VENGGTPDDSFQAVGSHQLKDLISFLFLQEIQEAEALFERLMNLPNATSQLYNIIQLPSDPFVVANVNKHGFFCYTGKSTEFVGNWNSISDLRKKCAESKVMFN
jgi:hypothetical protein